MTGRVLHPKDGEVEMGKILALLLFGAMTVHIIKPLNLPGLRYRRDFWKIAVAAIAIMMLTVLVRP